MAVHIRKAGSALLAEVDVGFHSRKVVSVFAGSWTHGKALGMPGISNPSSAGLPRRLRSATIIHSA